MAALAIFAGSLTLVPSLGVELIPQLAQDEFNVELRLPPGTPLETPLGRLWSGELLWLAGGLGEMGCDGYP